MLQQLHSDSKQFREERLLAMRPVLQALLVTEFRQPLANAVGGQRFRETAIETRQQGLLQRLETAFSNALDNSYVEFSELLKQSDSGRPLSKATGGESQLFPGLADRQSAECIQALGELNQRLSVLGGIKVTTSRNPFAPETFARAFDQALLGVRWQASIQEETADFFQRAFLAELPTLYAEMNRALANAGILPQLEAANQSMERDTPELGRQASVMPTGLINRPPANDSASEPADDKSSAQQRIEERQCRDVNTAKTVALELVSKLINQLLSYDDVSQQLKTHLSRLYSPFAHLAQSDPRFPDHPDHPGHRLLNTLERAVELFQTEALILQRPELVVLLKEFVRAIDEQALTSRQAYIIAFRINSQLRGMEHRIRARRISEQPALNNLDKINDTQITIALQVSERLQQASVKIPVKIEDFLLRTWTSYVSSLYVNPDIDRDQTERTLAMTDRIIQYAGGQQPMTGDQYTVIAISVRQAMTRCGATGPETESFLQQLKRAHAQPLANIVIGSHQANDDERGALNA